MACDIDDREGESPSPMEPRLGRTFRSSATGRRREQLFLRRSVFVKRFTREMTLPDMPAARRGRPGAMRSTEPRSRAQAGRATRIRELTAYAVTGVVQGAPQGSRLTRTLVLIRFGRR
jgi:hypothetical protein